MTMAAFINNTGDLIECNRIRKQGYSNYVEGKQEKHLISTVSKHQTVNSVSTVIRVDK